jgi:hypothetical protein
MVNSHILELVGDCFSWGKIIVVGPGRFEHPTNRYLSAKEALMSLAL